MKRLLATMVVLVAVLAACGDDAGDDTPKDVPTTIAPGGQGPRTGGSSSTLA
jgi:hypothetical protein